MQQYIILLLFLLLTACSTNKSNVLKNFVANDQVVIDPTFIENHRNEPSYFDSTNNQLQTKSSNKNNYKTKNIKSKGKEFLIANSIFTGIKYDKKLYQFWVNYFLKKDKIRFTKHLKTGEKYRKLVIAILEKYEIPRDFFYVGLIESGFNSKIKSRAKAAGPWQFMKGTAIRYGLRVDHLVDERYNIHKSTEAAAQYLKDLYNIFGSWELALCAYNKGEFGVIRAIKKGKTRDYNVLVKKRLLPSETRSYIPKIMAAKYVSTKRHNYKIRVQKQEGNFYKNVDYVKIKRTFNLSKLAISSGISENLLRNLNRDLKTKWTYIKRNRYHRLVIPRKFQTIGKKLDNYAKLQKVPKRTFASQINRSKYFIHKVTRGESLSYLSKKYNLSIRKIKTFNKLKRSKITIGQKLKILNSSRNMIYIVRRGDHLTGLAVKFGLSVKKIMSYNALKSKKIFVRQRLYIPTQNNKML